MKGLHMASVILVIVGALNWGLIGLLGLDVVKMVLGSMAGLEKILYILIGLSGVLLLVQHKGDCKVCSVK